MASHFDHRDVADFFYGSPDAASVAEVASATGIDAAIVAECIEEYCQGKYPFLRAITLSGITVYEEAPEPRKCYVCDCIIEDGDPCFCQTGGKR